MRVRMTDGELDSQDSFRGFHNDGVSRFNEPGIVGWCLPALMYLTCPAMHTTRLPSGRPSTSCLRLRSYSDAGIPGVISPGLTTRARARNQPFCQRRRMEAVVMCVPLAHRGGYGILRWVDRMWMAWLGRGAGAVELE